MSEPNFEQMTKDEIIDWFKTTSDLSPILVTMQHGTEPSPRTAADVPMMLASIRLPVELVEQIDNLAALQRTRRSDVIRDALTAYVVEKTSPVGQEEAEHALDVLRRLIVGRVDPRGRPA